MEEFLKLKWKIEGPHELDRGPEFIPEEEILKSYVYSDKVINKIGKVVNKETIKNTQKICSRAKYKLKTQIRSFLSVEEHSKCLKALQILQTGKKGLNLFEKGCIELYNNVQPQITEENKKFLDFAKRNFLNKPVKGGFTKPFENYAHLILKNKLEECKEYQQYYKEIDKLIYCYGEDETPIEMVHLANLLELGTLAKFARPSLLTPYHVSSNELPNTFEKFYSNLPVSKDLNAKKLLETNEAEVVISSSGLKKLLNFTKINCEWDIPIIVEEINFVKSNGVVTSRNVVFIDKPLPNTTPTKGDIIQKTLKLLLKSSLCKVEAVRYYVVEQPLSTKFENIVQNAKKNKKNEINKIKKICHNASYRMWHLRQEEKQSELMKTHYKTKDVKVLVRCKLDGCEVMENSNSVLQPVSLFPKLEYQPEFGASIPTKEELISQWTSLFFKPFSQLCRIRIACTSKEVLMLENCNIQKINNELHTHYNHKPSLGLGVLYKLFLELKTLSPGNYLLHHLPKHGSFISLLQSCNWEGCYDLYENYKVDGWRISEKSEEWCPIDCNLILPKHKAFDQMPGLFPPSIKAKKFNFKVNKTGSKNKKKRHKTKSSKVEESQ